MSQEAQYLKRQIFAHIRRFFYPEALQMLNEAKLHFVTFVEATELREPTIAIPTNIPAPLKPESPYQVPFNETYLTLWNRLPKPEGNNWSCVPDSKTPLWYYHRSGTVVPAWNLFANLFDLLTLREEREISNRDKHGRFCCYYSPRKESGLLEVPAFNEACAALVAAALGLKRERFPQFKLDGLARPVSIALSHDCDQLHGNDIWTQAIRCFHAIQPLFHGKFPKLINVYLVFRNVLFPRDFYYNNIGGLIDIETMFGFTSTFYLLNGTGGRFGARSGSKLLPEVVKAITESWEIGIHYNYDTHLNTKRFQSQKEELQQIAKREITAGRGHYLLFDPQRSFSFWTANGIRHDETVGYSDCVGFRCGIAGCFQPYDFTNNRELEILELPLVVMDNALFEQYSEDPVSAFRRILYHVNCVGGCLSVLFHPGCFFNPEIPEALRVYYKLLSAAHELGAHPKTALYKL